MDQDEVTWLATEEGRISLTARSDRRSVLNFLEKKPKTLLYRKCGKFMAEDVVSTILTSWFPKALSAFFKYYKGAFPPVPSFEDQWPECWRVYAKICDESAFELTKKGQTVPAFRKWMISQFETRISENDYDEIWQWIIRKTNGSSSTYSSSLFGLFGCLTVLSHGFRWGALPITQEAADFHAEEGSIEFPYALIRVWAYLCRFYGVPVAGCNLSFHNAVMVAEVDKESANGAGSGCDWVPHKVLGVRFSWNQRGSQGHIKMHSGTTEQFMGAECKAPPVFQGISDIFTFLLDLKQKHPDRRLVDVVNETKVEEKYVELLTKLEKYTVRMLSLRGYTLNLHTFPITEWVEYFQKLTVWNHGEVGGASGAQLLGFKLLDDFLMIDANIRSDDFETNTPATYLALVRSLSNGVSWREQVVPVNECSANIRKAYYRIISRIRGFRIMHRNLVTNAFKKGNVKTTSKRKIGNDGNESVADAFHEAMSNIIEKVEQTRQKHFSWKSDDVTLKESDGGFNVMEQFGTGVMTAISAICVITAVGFFFRARNVL